MKRLISSFALGASLLCSSPNALLDGRIAHLETHRTAHRVYLGSIAFLLAGQVCDFASSIGGHELNGAIGNNSSGTFSVGRGLAIKGIVIGTALGIEYAIHRVNGHSADKLSTGINAGLGGIGLAAAIHNWGVSK